MANWKKSTDKNENEYFYYPENEEIFKTMVAENEGFILDIYNSANNKIKRKKVNSGSKEWGSPVFGYLKTMQEDGKKYYELYNNCKFYAVPKNLVDILDSINSGEVDLSKLINDYVAHKKSSEYLEKYKWEFIEKFAHVFKDLSDIETFKNNLLTLFKNCNKTNLATKELMTQSRMFVSIVEEYPEEFRMAFLGLFDETASIDKRVDYFTIKINELREKIQWSWKITSSTAAFFLFVKDSNKYPCYSAVTRFHKYFELINYREYLQYKSKSIGLRYKALVDYIHDELIPTMNRVLNNTNTAIDAQDFIWYVGNLYLFEKNDKKKQLKDLTWWEISALGMYMNNKESAYKENDVKNTPFVQYAMGIKNNYKPSIGTELRECSNDETTNYKRKNEYFTRLDNNYYKLNKNGIEYIETELKHFLGLDLSTNEEAEGKGEKGMNSNIPLNQILYGPPGTGKTYSTVIEALKIIENIEHKEYSNEEYQELKQKFDDYLENGQIKMITFHQSYSYEEFIEGIRPVLDNENVKYNIEEGIFKKICTDAKSEYLKSNVGIDFNPSKNNIFKISLGDSTKSDDDEIYEHCIENNKIAIGYGGDIDYSPANTKKDVSDIFHKTKKLTDSDYTIYALNMFKNTIKQKDLVFVSKGNRYVRAIGEIVDNEYTYNPEANIKYSQFRNIKWLIKDVEIPIEKLYKKNLSQQTIYEFYSDKINFEALNGIIGTSKTDKVKPYVLIIDEINRGNISKIFGELITLIEEDKRLGATHELKVKLPYSPETNFGVPNNLYIVGTMNTSDRSIASVDIALRRRFEFKEIMPKSELVPQKIEGLDADFREIYEIINKKISILLDREHQIGHSYFIKVKNIDDLKEVWFNNIIPLLNEYFYGEWDKLKEIIPTFINEIKTAGLIFNTDLADENYYDFYKRSDFNAQMPFEDAIKLLQTKNKSENSLTMSNI